MCRLFAISFMMVCLDAVTRRTILFDDPRRRTSHRHVSNQRASKVHGRLVEGRIGHLHDQARQHIPLSRPLLQQHPERPRVALDKRARLHRQARGELHELRQELLAPAALPVAPGERGHDRAESVPAADRQRNEVRELHEHLRPRGGPWQLLGDV